MEFRSLTSITPRRLSMYPCRCVLFHHAKAFQFMVVLVCTIFHLDAFKPCSVKEMQSLVEYDSCESFRNNHNAGEVTSGYLPSRRTDRINLENTCGDANLFCFASTLPGFLAEVHDPEATVLEASAFQFDATLHVVSAQARNKLRWTDYVAFQLFGGQAGSCSQMAVISLPIQSHNSPTEVSNISLGFKLMIQTNGSNCPKIEVVCKDIVNIPSRLNSKLNYEQQSGGTEYGNVITGSLGRSVQSPLQTKEMEAEELDDLVLRIWKSQGTASGMSVIDDQEVLFPLVLVETRHSIWITVKNPSPQPIVMRLTLHSGEIIYEYRPPDGLLPHFSSSRFILSGYTTPRRYGSSTAEIALTEAYVPRENESFGPILFHPLERCGWSSSSLIRNKHSGVEWFSLQGYGGLNSLVLDEGSKLVENLEFRFSLISLLNLFLPDICHTLEEAICTCSQPISKEFFAEDAGDLTLEVERIKVSGTECGLDGFVVHSCEGCSVEPGESTMLLVACQADFSAGTVHRDLELDLGTGILLIPIKATLCLRMLNLCRRSAFWLGVKKFSLAIFFISVLVFLIFFSILPQLMALMTKDYFKNGLSFITAAERGLKSSCMVSDKRNSHKLAGSRKMESLMRSIGKEETSRLTAFDRSPDGQGVTTSEQGITAQHIKLTVGDQGQTNHLMEPDPHKKEALDSCSLLDSSTIKNHDPQEASKKGELKVRTGKEKGRRQRKKRSSGTGLVGFFEVSSSQSGNSTPSSPLSPSTSLTTKYLWSVSSDADQSIGAHNQVVEVVERQCEKSSDTEPACRSTTINHEVSVKNSNVNLTQEQPHAPITMAGEPVQLPSATLPSTSEPAPNLVCPSPWLISTSTIAPQARAPGSKLCNQKTVKTDEKVGLEDHFKYDIWGDHLFGLNLTGRSKEVSNVTKNHSDSFFVMGPQFVMTKSQLMSVSYSYQEG